MSFKPPRPCARARGRTKNIEVVVLGIPPLRSSFDRAENAFKLHDAGSLEIPLRAQSALQEAMGCDALLAGHVLKSDTIPISRYEMPIKALFSIERPRSFLEL